MFIGNISDYKVYVYRGTINIPDLMVFPYRIIVKVGTSAYHEILKMIE